MVKYGYRILYSVSKGVMNVDAKRLVAQIPDFAFRELMAGFLSSAAFSKFRIGERLADLTDEEQIFLMGEMKEIAHEKVSEKEALEIAYALTKREMQIGYEE